MAEERAQRHLAAILAADVVGYARLMEQDETDTFARLRAHRKELFEPEIEKHQGRIFKLMGDGLLAEFGSVVDAVECAVELQRGMASRNGDIPKEQRIEVRIGINLGDVIIESDDRHGDGVNVAARLQELSDPGGVLISGTAFDQVGSKLDSEFEFLGDQRVKNIEKPIRVYRVKLGGRRAAKAVATAHRPRRTRLWLAISIAALVLAAGGVAIWNGFLGGSVAPIEVASEGNMAFPLPDKPSIAVLPFTNMSGDPGQEHFADGMTDDLITDLSKISALFVIARNSTFAYKGKAVTIRDVAEDLGVRYVVEGSVQRAGDQLRVNAQLIDALTGGHVWADRFDGRVDDVFAVQDLFVRQIVEALEVRLAQGEIEEIARAKTDNITAKEAFDEGWNLYLRFNAEDNAAAVAHFKRAIELDPKYGRAYASLALVYFGAYDYAWYREPLFRSNDYLFNQEIGADAANWIQWYGWEYLEKARKYPTALAYTVDSRAYLYFGRAEDARREASRAIALDPNDPEARIAMAWALTTSGEPNEALYFIDQAIRLNPNFPSHYVLAHGVALFAANDLERAAEVFDKGVKQNPDATALLPPFASVLARLGRRDEAREMLLVWRPGADQATLEDLARDYNFPFRWAPEHRRVRERLLDGVQVAALPLAITVSSLTAELNHGDLVRRQVAARRLGWFGPAAAEAVPALVKSLGDGDVRQQAVQSLGKIGPEAKTAIPALVAIQNEKFIGDYVKDALKEIRGY